MRRSRRRLIPLGGFPFKFKQIVPKSSRWPLELSGRCHGPGFGQVDTTGMVLSPGEQTARLPHPVGIVKSTQQCCLTLHWMKCHGKKGAVMKS